MQTSSHHLKIGDGRRIVLPSEICNSLHLDVGDTVIVAIENDHAVLRSIDSTVDRFQSLVAQSIAPGTSLVDELIDERRENARHE